MEESFGHQAFGYLTGLAGTHMLETKWCVMGLELSLLTENISTEAPLKLVKASLTLTSFCDLSEVPTVACTSE